MSDPQTPQVGLYVPSHNSDTGSWDQPCNANFSVTDSLAANVATIGLTNANVTLSTPPNSGAAWAGPYQSQSALIRFTGALTASVSVNFPRAGFYIVENLCVVGNSYYVTLFSSGGGRYIGAPPGQKVYVFNDGTNMDFVDLPPVGSYLDIAFWNGDGGALPLWMEACSVPPYLVCNGTTFSATTYPQLAVLLNGTTLPDLRGRMRAMFNQGTARIYSSGVNGDVLFAAGGADTEAIGVGNLPNYNLPIYDPGHSHGYGETLPQSGGSYASAAPFIGKTVAANTNISATGIVVNTGGSNIPLVTLPPVQIAGVTLIRGG